MKSIFLLLTLCFASACGPRYVDFFPYYDNGVPKPQVVLLPLKAPADCPVGFTDAFLSEMRYQFMDHGDIYLFSDAEIEGGLAKLPACDLYGRDVAWSQAFCPADYVVVMETLEHRPYRYPKGCTLSYVLIKLRLKVIDLRVIDLRHGCPRVIANELIETCQRICPDEGETIYDLSVSSGAHRHLAKKIVDRIEAIVWSQP